MDLVRFDALVGSMDRISSLEKINTAWLNLASAQGTVKGMKDILKPLEQRINKSFAKEDTTKSAAAFITRINKGFK